MAANPLDIAAMLQSGFAGAAQRKQNAQQFGVQAGQSQQRIDLEKRQQQVQESQEQRLAQQADLDFHNHLIEMGAVAGDARSGLIKDTQTMPSYPGGLGGGQPVSIVRKMDPARTVKFKDADGEDVAYELPDAQTQALRQLRLGPPGHPEQGDAGRARAVQQAGDVAESTAAGTGRGQSTAKAADLQARGISPTDQEVQQFSLDPQQKYLPEDLVGMHRNAVAPTIRNQGAGDRQTQRLQSRKDLQDTQDAFKAQQQQQALDYKDRWQQARVALAGNSAGNLNNRVLSNQIDKSQAQHSKLLDQISGETSKQLDTQELLDPDLVGDGDTFTDPWLKKDMQMSKFQRSRLNAQLEASKSHINELRGEAQGIEQKYGLGGFAPGAGTTPSNVPGAGAAPAASGSARPGAAGAPVTPSRTAPPNTQNGNTVRIRTSDGQLLDLPKANLEKAKQRDPKLQVIPQ